MNVLKEHPQLIIKLWLGSVITLFLLLSLTGVERSLHERYMADQAHLARMDPSRSEPGKTQPEYDKEKLKQSEGMKVTAGMYIDRITDVSITDASWTADFYLWFRWTNGDINPGDNVQVIDGELVKKELIIPPNGVKSEMYALYRIKARITKFFNTTLFPRDDHLLTIKIEDKSHQIYNMQYNPDVVNTDISSRVEVQGYEIYRKELVSKPHSYKTRRGDPSIKAGDMNTYSQLIYGIWIRRPGWGVYMKMFEGLFAAVAVALLTFFISVTGTNRTSLGVGAFFAAVAATYVAERSLPQIGVLTLTNIINGFALLMIFLTIWHTIIVTRLFEVHGDADMIRRYDRYGFVIFLFGFVIVNVALVVFTSR